LNEPVNKILEAAVLGTVQGLTEFLPISSTAHLRAVPALLHWPDPGVAYSAVIQLGSVVAVLVYFAKDLFQITSGFIKGIKEKDYGATDVRLFSAIMLGTIPICVLGLLFKKLLETEHGPLRELTVIAVASIVMACLLALAERIGARTRSVQDMGVKDGLLIGMGQALALVPGCSRSGSTLSVALLLGMKRDDAARFSFLLGIPAIVLSGLLEFKKVAETGLDATGMSSLITGLVAATVVSYASIWFMISYLKSHSTMVFIIYRLIFGIGILYLALTKQIS
jgi:undecaprenyl-diphosphatase